MICELGAELLKQIYIAEQVDMADLKGLGETIAEDVGMPQLAETVQTLMSYGLVVDAVAQRDEAMPQQAWASLDTAHVTPKGLSVLCHLGIL